MWENDQEIADALDLCYTTDLYTARAKKWIADHRAAHADQPFFLYLAYDTPHAKLQYPPCAYPENGVRWTGKPGAMLNTATGGVDSWCDPAVANATWDHDGNTATPEVPWPEVQKRHATSVRRIDAAVGDLVRHVKELGIDEETLIVFTSDNGPAAESYLPKKPYAPTFFAGFGPFDGIKRDVLEGGVREPTFVRWTGQIPAGQVTTAPSGQWDWLPTFAELAGLPAPAASDGVSLVPTLIRQGAQRPSTIYVEYFQEKKTPAYPQFAPAHRERPRQQMQLVMEGGLTGVRYDIQSPDQDFAIYDVESDPQQTKDLSATPGMTALQQRMKARVLQLRRPDPSAPRPYDDALVPPITGPVLVEGRIDCRVYEGNWPWVPEFSTLDAVRRESVSAIDLSACPKKDYTGMAFVGYFRAAQPGNYSFTVTSNGGAVLFLHDARVVDDDYSHTSNAATGTIRLAAGWHPLRLYYRHATGKQRLEITCVDPNGVRQPLAADLLGTDSRSLDRTDEYGSPHHSPVSTPDRVPTPDPKSTGSR